MHLPADQPLQERTAIFSLLSLPFDSSEEQTSHLNAADQPLQERTANPSPPAGSALAGEDCYLKSKQRFFTHVLVLYILYL